MKRLTLISIPFLFVFQIASAFAGSQEVAYPEGYRQWTHVKSMILQPGHPLENPFQGLHHVYANEEAMQGLSTGTFPDGSTLVFDLFHYKDEGHAIQTGDRKLVGVMQKNQSRFNRTGGWGFEGFAGNSKSKRLVKDGGQQCFACHQSQSSQDFVFSKFKK